MKLFLLCLFLSTSLPAWAGSYPIFFPMNRRVDIAITSTDGDAARLYDALNVEEVEVIGYRGKALPTSEGDFLIDCMTPLKEENYTCRVRIFNGPRAKFSEEEQVAAFIASEDAAAQELFNALHHDTESFQFSTVDGKFSLRAVSTLFRAIYSRRPADHTISSWVSFWPTWNFDIEQH